MKPQVNIDILLEYGAICRTYDKGELLFSEGDDAKFYFQIVSGSIKMFNTNDDGKEFTQGYFTEGQSFGEPPLFINEKYPAAAMVFHTSELVKLKKERFLKLLNDYPEIGKEFLVLMAKRIHHKATTSKDIINQKAEFRIQAFLDSYKKTDTKEYIDLTRQEIANFTGLRVETVIRALGKMKKEQIVEIKNQKLYY